MRKLRVLFIAGLDPVAQGGAGGQLAVASQLFRSPLGDLCDLIPISSTQRRSPPPPLPVRAYFAAGRLLKVLRLLSRSDVALIFTSDGPGLVEKGFYCLLARAAGKGVVLRTGSGSVANLSRKTLWHWWLRKVFGACHVICSQGTYWTRCFQQYREATNKIVVTPNGVLIPVKAAVPRQREPLTVTFVGRIEKEKGLNEALEAFLRVRQTHPKTQLLLAGQGSGETSLRKKVEALGLTRDVHFLGWLSRDEVHDLLARTDVFIMPSHSEGMPNALLEAMAHGVAVIATPVGAVEDLVEHAKTGRLVPVGDVAALANEIRLLLDDPGLRARLGEQGRQRVRSRYDASVTWQPFWEAVQRAAAEAGIYHPNRESMAAPLD